MWRPRDTHDWTQSTAVQLTMFSAITLLSRKPFRIVTGRLNARATKTRRATALVRSGLAAMRCRITVTPAVERACTSSRDLVHFPLAEMVLPKDIRGDR